MTKRTVLIVDYGMGNLASIANMFKKVGIDSKISSDPVEVRDAAKLVLPGVGAFDAGMRNLNDRGLAEPLNVAVLERLTPVLGLCLGMQLMTARSEEGAVPGLGWIEATTVRFAFPEEPSRKIPHMGWNAVDVRRESGLTRDIAPDARFYFVHSFHLKCENSDDVVGETVYGYRFVSIIQRDNICGVQFHPEKSHRFGMSLFARFGEIQSR